jgi:hypothetical protein
MPKIPTFTSKARPTEEVGSIQSNIKIDPTRTMGAALSAVAGTVQDYYIKKRDNEEKLIAKKAVLELKSETDKIIQSQKDNISEEESISNYKQTFTPLLQNKLSTIQNRRVKKLVEQSIDLENSENIYHLKQNSFKAYEKESAKIYNEEIQAGAAKYKTETNEKLKEKYKNTLHEKARLFNEEHMLGSNDLKKRIETIDSVLLLGDADSLIGTPGAVDKIKQLDKSINGVKFLSDEIFNNSIYNSYAQKIESLTVKGDPNADFEEAERLVNELKTSERYTGSKTISGKREQKFATLKQKVLTESINHDTFVRKVEQGNKFYTYQTEQKKLLEANFFNSMIPTMNKAVNKERAAESGLEYDARLDLYVQSNPDASYAEQQQYARQLRLNLYDKYQDVSTEQITAFNLTENKFNVVRETANVYEWYNEYKKNPSLKDADGKPIKNTLVTLAKLNGYVDENGKVQINKFFNEYIEILKKRQEG